jgi:CrcB protein
MVGENGMSALSFVAIGSGAAFGAWLRWALGALINSVYPPMPLGTLAANLLGSFLMGLALVLLVERGLFPPEIRLAAITGFLGSLTTMSTFSAEAMILIARADYAIAAGLVSLHVAGSILMIFVGVATARVLAGS